LLSLEVSIGKFVW